MFTATGPAPTRSTTSITLSWGLLSIPLGTYSATEPPSTARKEFVKGTDHPVGRQSIDKVTGLPVVLADVVKKAVATSGELVELSDDEIAACTTPKGLAQIVTFVPRANRSQYLIDTYYQVRPHATKGKTDPGSSKAFSLLMSSMRDQNLDALISVAMRGPAKWALLTSDGELLVLYPDSRIRQALPIDLGAHTPAELELAESLVKAIGVSVPDLGDDTAIAIQAYVDSKATGIIAEAPAPVEPVIDVVAALLASVKAAQEAKAVAS